MWSDFIKIISILFVRIDKENIELRDRVSKKLYDIHLLIDEIIIKLKNDEIITNCFPDMSKLTNGIYDDIKNFIRVEEMDKIYKLLNHCSYIDIEFDGTDVDNKIKHLSEVSEEIRILSLQLVENYNY